MPNTPVLVKKGAAGVCTLNLDENEKNEVINFLESCGLVLEVEEEKLESCYNKIATTNGVKNWITSLNRNEVAANTDYLETVNSVAKSYLTQTNAASTYSTKTETELTVLYFMFEIPFFIDF
jgi:hypothetical protein